MTLANYHLLPIRTISGIASNGRGHVRFPHRSNEPVSCVAYGLNVAWLFGVVAQRFLNFLTAKVQPAVKVAMGLAGPQRFFDLFAGDKLFGTLDQRAKTVISCGERSTGIPPRRS